MSKIKIVLDQYGAGPFEQASEQQQFVTVGVEGVNMVAMHMSIGLA